jgi:2',3'-cyclic-nucleotide 2'-phosphodiesterase (5'-nucleotidase family)
MAGDNPLLEQLLILYTNDIHGRFGQMPKIATAFRLLKEACPGVPSLTVDAGDHMDRSQAMTEGTMGRANIAVMNAAGYEAATWGNNEGLTFPRESLADLYGRQAGFAALCSNMFDLRTGDPPPYLFPQRVVRKGTLRIGLIGVTPLSRTYEQFYRALGWEVRDPAEMVRQRLATLRGEADIVVVLSHLGLAADLRMAERIHGIDVIIGGHSHDLLHEPRRVGETYVCTAGEYGRHVGRLLLTFDRRENRIAAAEGDLVAVDGLPPDPETVRLIEHYRRESERHLSGIAATLPRPLSCSWSEESALGNLLAAGLRKFAGAEIGLVNAGQFAEGMERGEVTKERLMAICPSLIYPSRFVLRGEHIARALEEALLAETVFSRFDGLGFRGKVVGTLCIDGMRVVYDPARPAYAKIREVRVGGQLLQPEREYTVGGISLFAFGKIYPSLANYSEVEHYPPLFLRDILQRELGDADAGADAARWIVDNV